MVTDILTLRAQAAVPRLASEVISLYGTLTIHFESIPWLSSHMEMEAAGVGSPQGESEI